MAWLGRVGGIGKENIVFKVTIKGLDILKPHLQIFFLAFVQVNNETFTKVS